MFLEKPLRCLVSLQFAVLLVFGLGAGDAQHRVGAQEEAAPSQKQYEAGYTFKACNEEWCPELVVLLPGSFMMGSPESEQATPARTSSKPTKWRPYKASIERPQHEVTISAPIAVGKYEVTFDQWDACVAAGGCNGYMPPDEGWGRGNRPVNNVHWDDVQAYVAWLSEETGKTFRLLTEAEWEYAARAGSSSPYSSGVEIGENQANCKSCGSEWDNMQTAPVGSFEPNAFGLYDMHGNLWEWVEDCWNDSYVGAPSNGSAWNEGDCSKRVLRGGSWNFAPLFLRSARRFFNDIDDRYYDNGFRIARVLD